MRAHWILAGGAALALSACSERGDDAAYEMAEADAAAAPAEEIAASVNSSDASAAKADPAIAVPQIAYRYELGFRLPANAIKPLQERHADMCEARGPDVCRIITMRQADSDGDYAYGNLQIAIAADTARAFSKELESSSGNLDADLISSSISGEDLSKAIVDTEAKLRARSLLRDRLMEVLRTRQGTVAELVEAERGVAQVNEEIDQARSWLNEMRGRVAFSQMAISYESGARVSGGFVDPIRSAWGSLGAILGSLIAFLMMGFTVLGPLALIALGGARLWRWAKSRADTASAS